MPETVLVCTVGGSPEPILTAIRDLQPSYVVFVCSTGPKSSRPQVEGDENDQAIVAKAALVDGSWQILEVPPDDPDGIFLAVEAELRELAAARPGARIVVDYTGGTKSMSIGAALAALASGVELSLTTGERRDLIKVAPGTERVTPVGFRGVTARFAIEQAEDAWQRFAYGDAAELLGRAHRDLTLADDRTKTARELRARVGRLLVASRMFEAWDRFDHEGALYVFRKERFENLPGMSPYGEALKILASDEREPLVLLDLWLNAERRALGRRFDDALGRLYRLVEWTAQFVLRTECGIDTASFDPAVLPEGELRKRLAGRIGRNGRLPIGLFDALAVLEVLLPDHPFVCRFRAPLIGRKPLTDLQSWIEARNRSILAHGFVPVAEPLWQQAHGWMQTYWLPWLHDELRARSMDLPQFPTAFPV